MSTYTPFLIFPYDPIHNQTILGQLLTEDKELIYSDSQKLVFSSSQVDSKIENKQFWNEQKEITTYEAGNHGILKFDFKYEKARKLVDNEDGDHDLLESIEFGFSKEHWQQSENRTNHSKASLAIDTVLLVPGYATNPNQPNNPNDWQQGLNYFRRYFYHLMGDKVFDVTQNGKPSFQQCEEQITIEEYLLLRDYLVNWGNLSFDQTSYCFNYRPSTKSIMAGEEPCMKRILSL